MNILQPPFALYPEERHWWSFNDYGAVLAVMRRLKPAAVLEFGPGSSTLALIEGGATWIDTCEDDPDWAAVYAERLEQRWPAIVTLHRYTWAERISIPALQRRRHPRRHQLALIDGPRGETRRPAVLRYCLKRAIPAILVPTEDGSSSNLRPQIQAIADEAGYAVEWIESGPPSGGFALLQAAL